jgi:uncharacterized repeat protein (TIGR03803 family)
MANPAQYRRGILKTYRVIVTAAALLAFGTVLRPAQAQTFSTLYTFTGGADGGHPYASLLRDSKGNLYGTTYYFGSSDLGVAFMVDANGGETVLHTFGYADGAYPYSNLIQDAAGNLYGTTSGGGTYGAGTVFKITPEKRESVLYSFTAGTDGGMPMGGLVRDKLGNLYGTTESGGSAGLGNVFRLSKTGKVTTLHSFVGSDGANPYLTGLLLGNKGNLYGVAQLGGSFNEGVIYRVTTKGKFKVLHNFAGGTTDGCVPMGIPVMDKQGNLYGTSEACGSSSYGTVWELTPQGVEIVLHNFIASDGAFPYAGVVLDGKGNLYGDTQVGGSVGYGTVYRLNAGGGITLLHSFDQTNGANPYGGVIRDSHGTLYGTVSDGGTDSDGIVWSVTP